MVVFFVSTKDSR